MASPVDVGEVAAVRPDLSIPEQHVAAEAGEDVHYVAIDNPQVKGIIVAISKGGSDKYGVSNPQGAEGKINILSSPMCH